MDYLWLILAVVLVIGIIKTSVKLLKFLFSACLAVGAVLFILSMLGIL